MAKSRETTLESLPARRFRSGWWRSRPALSAKCLDLPLPPMADPRSGPPHGGALRQAAGAAAAEGRPPVEEASGIVAPEDAFVVAINPKRLRHEIADTDPPRILQAAYPVGSPYVALDPSTGTAVDAGYQFRDKIRKSSGAEVSTGVFLLDEYASLSGLLCSRVDVANQPEKMGSDFQLVENCKAKAPLPDIFRLKGVFFRIEKVADGYVAVSYGRKLVTA